MKLEQLEEEGELIRRADIAYDKDWEDTRKRMGKVPKVLKKEKRKCGKI